MQNVLSQERQTWYKHYKERIKRGRKRRISLCETGMEIASLKFPNWSAIFIRADVVLKFHLSLMVDGRKSSPQWGTEGSPVEACS